MKIALVQDWFVVNGGAEKIVREILEIFPNADVFSLVDFLNKQDREDVLKGKVATTSFLQKIPFAEKSYRNFLPLFPIAIESLDLSGYDLIVSSSYSVAKGIKKNNNQIHICYCHSPIRYAWDLEAAYLSELGWMKRMIASITLAYIRKWDIKTVDRVDLFIANSNNIAERIKRIYHRDACVVYPPVDTAAFVPCKAKKNYYFTSARLVAYKRVDLMVQAFNALPQLQLIVSGEGPELNHLKAIANKNITFTGYLAKPDLVKYMQEAKAFILAAEEDFGITSLEAQSCSTPVIAFKKGGYLETVKEGKTGLFFDAQTADSLKAAILKMEERTENFSEIDFRANAENFSTEQFRNEFKRVVNAYIQTRTA